MCGLKKVLINRKNAVPAFTLKRRSVVVSENTFYGKSAAEKVSVHPILVWWR